MSTSHWFTSKVRDLDPDECLRLLRSRQVGRIAFVDADGPDVLPVNFVVDGDCVLVATSSYGTIARAATGAPVAFEVDEIDDYTESGWSVVVRGHAVRESSLDRATERPYPWAEGTRNYLLRIKPFLMTGRRLVPS